jgi:hypothetical protein
MRRYLPVRMMSTSVPCVARSKSQDAGPASVECPDMSDLKGLAAAEWAGRVLAETASGREAVRASSMALSTVCLTSCPVTTADSTLRRVPIGNASLPCTSPGSSLPRHVGHQVAAFADIQ